MITVQMQDWMIDIIWEDHVKQIYQNEGLDKWEW